MAEEMHEYGHKVGSLLAHSLGAVVGFVAANYVDSYVQGQAWGPGVETAIGLITFGVPVFLLKGGEHWSGPVRLMIGVAGLSLTLRGIFGNGTAGSGLLSMSLPAQVYPPL